MRGLNVYTHGRNNTVDVYSNNNLSLCTTIKTDNNEICCCLDVDN